jgi:FixJ family two-component response regulator
MRGKRLTLGVVDDDADVRRAIERLLRAFGHDVHPFASAEAFQANRVPVDCLVVDVRLSGLSGFELDERLRLDGSAVPVVLITADADIVTQRAQRGMSALDAPLLSKPFDDDRLMSAIDSAVTGFERAS